MTRLFSIHEVAESEINEAADFYDLESPGLGSVFIEEVERAIESITHFPDAAPFIRGRVRRRLCSNSPILLSTPFVLTK
jgi:toxin ParE1/3/4